jgi:hypothetical protein
LADFQSLKDDNMRIKALLESEKLALAALKDKLLKLQTVSTHEQQQLHSLNSKVDDLKRSRLAMFNDFQSRIAELQQKPVPPSLPTCTQGHLLARLEKGAVEGSYAPDDDSFSCDVCSRETARPGARYCEIYLWIRFVTYHIYMNIYLCLLLAVFTSL